MLKSVMTWFAALNALALALVLALGLLTIASMSHLRSVTNDLYEHPFTVNNASLHLKGALFDIRNHMLQIVLMKNKNDDVAQLIREIERLDQEVSADLDVIKDNFLGDMSRVVELEHLLVEWKTIRSDILRLERAGKQAEAEHAVRTVGTPKFGEIFPSVNYVVSFAQQRAKDFIAEADQEAVTTINRTWWLQGSLIAMICTAGGIVAWRISLIIRREQEVEAALKKYSTQLEDANKELESFSYSVSHDLRVPLRAIDGFSRIIQEEYQNKLDDEGQRLLNVVRDNTKKMAQLIDDILAFSRAGRQAMTTTEINMADLVGHVIEELAPAIAGRQIKLEIKPLPAAYADRIMMDRVLTNLLANALKFTQQTAEPQIEVGAMTDSRETVYYVKDNGVGFDMKYVDKLFGMFQRLHGSEEFEGTGIGLSIVKRIISRHGGRVWAEGKPNGGATIYFVLPAKEKEHG